MDLNESTSFNKLDTLDMLGEIDRLPDQLRSAWDLGRKLPDPWGESEPPRGSIRQVVLSGMGGSAIGADLLVAYLASTCRIPLVVWRDYGLPAWGAWTRDTGDRLLPFRQHGRDFSILSRRLVKPPAVFWSSVRAASWRSGHLQPVFRPGNSNTPANPAPPSAFHSGSCWRHFPALDWSKDQRREQLQLLSQPWKK